MCRELPNGERGRGMVSDEVRALALEIVRGMKLRDEHSGCGYVVYPDRRRCADCVPVGDGSRRVHLCVRHDGEDCKHGRRAQRYCVHGSYVGTWDGPDYLCGWCESGVGVYEFALSEATEIHRENLRENRFTPPVLISDLV